MSDTHDASAPETREAAPPWNDDLQDLRRRAEIFRRLAEKSPVPVVLTRFGTSEILFTNTEADRVFDTGVPGARTMALNRYLGESETPWTTAGGGLVDPSTMTTVEQFLRTKAALPDAPPTVV